MPKIIIYPNHNGGIAVIIPALDCGMVIEQIASKDVPVGFPYKIIDTSDVPTDRTFRDAWVADFTTFDGVGDAE